MSGLVIYEPVHCKRRRRRLGSASIVTFVRTASQIEDLPKWSSKVGSTLSKQQTGS